MSELSNKAKKNISNSRVDKGRNCFVVSWEEEYPLEAGGNLKEFKIYLKKQLNNTVQKIKDLKQQGEEIRERIGIIEEMEKSDK